MHDPVAAGAYVTCRDVLCDQSARADIRACSDRDPAHDHGAPADERAVFDGCRRFFASRVVPRNRRVQMAVDELSRDPAARSDPAAIADVAPDHRALAHGHADADPGAACHQDPWPDHSLGLYGDEILDYRIRPDHHTEADGGVLAYPHVVFHDGLTVNRQLAAIEERTKRVTDDRGRRYPRGRGYQRTWGYPRPWAIPAAQAFCPARGITPAGGVCASEAISVAGPIVAGSSLITGSRTCPGLGG